tara:strand:+ start:64 stop:216 length:153 start_codon:yes stop_codon:yes gene_type:complete
MRETENTFLHKLKHSKREEKRTKKKKRKRDWDLVGANEEPMTPAGNPISL